MRNRSTSTWWVACFTWIVSISVLTWKLLDPNPIPKGMEPPIDLAYLLAKSFHVCCYSFVTALGLWLSPSPKWRIGYVALMVWHAIGTEIAQSYIPTRSGSVKDVAFDYLGITIGCLVIWAWNRIQKMLLSNNS
jgi:VanZ family protein